MSRDAVLAQGFPLTRGGSLRPEWAGFWVSPGYTLDPPGCVGVSDGMVQPLIGKLLVQVGEQLHKQATDRLI